MTLLEALKARLTSELAGTPHASVPIALGRRPASPDTVLVLQAYAPPPSRILDGRNQPADERHAVQITARAANQRAAEVLARAAHDALAGRHISIDDTNLDWVQPRSLPFPTGVDANDRHLVVANLLIRKRGLRDQ